jgi:formylglycine-generating enzyme required for sulfatase activity
MVATKRNTGSPAKSHWRRRCASARPPIDLDGDGGPTLAADGGPTSFADPATVSSFRLDKYLVTVGRFRQYLNYVTSDGGAPPANGSGIHTHLNGGLGLVNSGDDAGLSYEKGWDATDWNQNQYIPGPLVFSGVEGSQGDAWWTSTAGNNENRPMICVTWYQAYAFCIWDGGFLPSETEWEYAAAGVTSSASTRGARRIRGRRISTQSTIAIIRTVQVCATWRTSRRWGRRRWERVTGVSWIWRAKSLSGLWIGTPRTSIHA